jgi:hypothetical protein
MHGWFLIVARQFSDLYAESRRDLSQRLVGGRSLIVFEHAPIGLADAGTLCRLGLIQVRRFPGGFNSLPHSCFLPYHAGILLQGEIISRKALAVYCSLL